MVTASTSWMDTELWKALGRCDGSGAEAVQAALRAPKCMNMIEAWLKYAAPEGTADFTLHDAEHGFRVAERMIQVMPAQVLPKLSAYELGLLLMSAYLHDIGMTPRRGLVKELWNYLAIGPGPAEKISTLPPEWRNEIPEFRRYLDDRGVEPGLLSQRLDASTRGTVDELVAYYCRRRHNAWSKAWIDEYLQGQQFGEFQSWIEALTDLCLSHHYGKERLLSDRFDPRLVSNSGEMVNIRYLACVLRIADILENDPKRTPEIVFQQRDVQSSSRIYWFKDHEFFCKIESAESGSGRKLTVSARPKRAAMERACRETMEAIAAELRLCRAVHEEKPFNHARGLKSEQYTWDLLDLITDDIRNANNAYVYIDGAFRPDTKRILQLLSGNALYGEPLASIRELLQNAFDAVRESIAHERLAVWDSLRPEEQKDYSWASYNDALRTVTLRIESEIGSGGARAYWLTCTDEGVGMSRSILERHLLVSGAASRADLRDLERRCEAAGFSLGRTGQFGIGVLSYFMIADRVEIWTRRDPRAGGDDGTGWYFETEGVGAFGELRNAPDVWPGTKVRLRLREDRLGKNVLAWVNRLSRYIRETLVRIPCRFRFDGTHEGGEAFTFERGWTPSPVDPLELLSRAKPYGLEAESSIITSNVREEFEAANKVWTKLQEDMRRTVRWAEVSGELPEHLGYYRANIAYFELMGGLSLAFLHLSQKDGDLLCHSFLSGLFHPQAANTRLAWKGMSTEARGLLHSLNRRNFGAHMAIVEIDVTSPRGGTISVDRNHLALNEIKNLVINAVQEAICGALRKLAVRIAEGKHLLISQSCVDFDLGVRSPSLYWPWLMRDADGISKFASETVEIVRVTEPIVIDSDLGDADAELNWKSSARVMRLQPIRPYGGYSADRIRPSLHLVRPDRVVQYKSKSSRYAGVLVESACALYVVREQDASDQTETLCRFPSSWKSIAALLSQREVTVLNVDNDAVAVANKSELKRYLELQPVDLYQRVHEMQRLMLAERGSVAAWLVACAVKSVGQEEARSLWKALQESESVPLERVWRLAFGAVASNAKVASICVLVEHYFSLRVLEFSLSAIRTIDGRDAIAEGIIPDPGAEWTVFNNMRRSNSEEEAAPKTIAHEHAGRPKAKPSAQGKKGASTSKRKRGASGSNEKAKQRAETLKKRGLKRRG